MNPREYPAMAGSARQILEEIFAIAQRATRINQYISSDDSSILPSCWEHHHRSISIAIVHHHQDAPADHSMSRSLPSRGAGSGTDDENNSVQSCVEAYDEKNLR
jgi:hypothetical protein